MHHCHSTPSLHSPHDGSWSAYYDRVPTFLGILLPEFPRKMQSALQKNEPHAVMEYVSSFLCHPPSQWFSHFVRPYLLSASIWKDIQEANFLRSHMSENFLSLHLVDLVITFYVQNNFPSEFWESHFWCSNWASFQFPILHKQFDSSSWKLLRFMITCFDLGPFYSNPLFKVLSRPFQSGNTHSSVLGNFLVLFLW